MGTLFGESEHIKSTFIWAAKITSFVSSSPKLLALLRAQGKRRPKKACEVRWYSEVNMSESLIENEEIILETLQSHQDRQKLLWMTEKLEWTNLKRATKILRPLANCIATAEGKSTSLGEGVACMLAFCKELFSSDWSDPLIVEYFRVPQTLQLGQIG